MEQINKNIMNDNFIISKIKIEDIPGLVKLYNRVWPENSHNRYEKTKWAIVNSKYKGMLAEADGEIIGSRVAFFCKYFLWP